MKSKSKILIGIIAGSIIGTIALSTIFISIIASLGRSKSASSEVPRHNSETIATTAHENYISADEAMYNGEFDIDYEFEELSNTGNVLNHAEDPSYITASRMLIRTVNCTMETANFEDVVNSIQESTNNLGGYFESSNISGTGNNSNYRSAYMTIRIPANKLDELTESLSGLATVVSSSESCEDVTINYVDTEARINSLRVEQETLNNLLAEATDLDTILILQNELTSVRYEIESYERILRTLSDQVAYSTLNINVIEVIEEPEIIEIEEVREKTFKEKISEAFNNSIENIKEDSKENFIGFISNAPYIILFIIILAIGAGVVSLIVLISKKAYKKHINKKQKLENKETKNTTEETSDK